METTPRPSGHLAVLRLFARPLLAALAGRWTTDPISALGAGGPKRFGALLRALPGILLKVLTQRLRELEADRLIWRHYKAPITPKRAYGVTDVGARADGVLRGPGPVVAAWMAGRVARSVSPPPARPPARS